MLQKNFSWAKNFYKWCYLKSKYNLSKSNLFLPISTQYQSPLFSLLSERMTGCSSPHISFLRWNLLRTWWIFPFSCVQSVYSLSEVFPVAFCFNTAAALHLKTKSASIFHSLFILFFMIMTGWLQKSPFRESKQILAPVSRCRKTRASFKY